MSKTTIPRGGITADAIDGTLIADDAINSEHYTDGSIDTAHIGDSQVTLAKTSGVGGGGYTRSVSARDSRRGCQYGFMGGGLVDLVDIYD